MIDAVPYSCSNNNGEQVLNRVRARVGIWWGQKRSVSCRGGASALTRRQ